MERLPVYAIATGLVALVVAIDDQVMIRLLEHRLGDKRRHAHAFEARHGTCALGRSILLRDMRDKQEHVNRDSQ